MAAARGEADIVKCLVSEFKIPINPVPDDPCFSDWITPLEAAIRGEQVEMSNSLLEWAPVPPSLMESRPFILQLKRALYR